MFSTEVYDLERTASPYPENNFASAIEHEMIDVVSDLVWFNIVGGFLRVGSVACEGVYRGVCDCYCCGSGQILSNERGLQGKTLCSFKCPWCEKSFGKQLI